MIRTKVREDIALQSRRIFQTIVYMVRGTNVTSVKFCDFAELISQGEIGCFHNSEKLRKPDGSKFRCVSAGRFRRETCKMKMEALFRVSAAAALPLT